MSDRAALYVKHGVCHGVGAGSRHGIVELCPVDDQLCAGIVCGDRLRAHLGGKVNGGAHSRIGVAGGVLVVEAVCQRHRGGEKSVFAITGKLFLVPACKGVCGEIVAVEIALEFGGAVQVGGHACQNHVAGACVKLGLHVVKGDGDVCEGIVVGAGDLCRGELQRAAGDGDGKL